MTDVLTPSQRKFCMSQIRGTNTNPELIVRRLLFRRGWRFRLHDPKLPGKPDIVLRKVHAVILVHGCFWHRHQCELFRWPSTNQEFWRKKINSNAAKDRNDRELLINKGWRVLTIWECALRGRIRVEPEQLLLIADSWLKGPEMTGEIFGELLDENSALS